MAVCWSCTQEAGESSFCAACGKIQPGRPRDAFALFGIAPRFHLDESVLEKSYRDLSRKLHPDKGGDPEAFKQMYAAYRTLLAVVKE